MSGAGAVEGSTCRRAVLIRSAVLCATGALCGAPWACGGEAIDGPIGAGGTPAGSAGSGAGGAGGAGGPIAGSAGMPSAGASGGSSGSSGSSASGGTAGDGGASGAGSGGAGAAGGSSAAAPEACGRRLIEFEGDAGQLLGNVGGASNDFDGCRGEGPEEIFVWRSPSPGRHLIDTFGSRFDTVLYASPQLACDEEAPDARCNDDFAGGLQSLLAVESEPGEDLFIVVDSYNSSTGPYVLNFRGLAECPAHDLGSEIGSGLYVTADLVAELGLLPEGGVEECNGAPVGVTFAWQAPAAGTYRFTTDGSSFDTVLALRGACAGDLFACDDDGSDEQRAASLEGFFDAGQRAVIELAPYVLDGSEGFTGAVLNIEAL